jgi:hypothetical protein
MLSETKLQMVGVVDPYLKEPTKQRAKKLEEVAVLQNATHCDMVSGEKSELQTEVTVPLLNGSESPSEE